MDDTPAAPASTSQVWLAAAYEVDALEPKQKIVRDVITSVIDVDAYNREVDAEKADAAYLEAMRLRALKLFEGIDRD